MIRRLLVLLLFCSFAVSAVAQTKSTFRININVEVSDDDDLALEADRYLNHALRSLGDVEVVDTKPTYTIQALVQKYKISGSDEVGAIAISWLTLHHSAANPSLVEVVSHAVWIGSQDSLRNKCEEYVARIDSEILEPQQKRLKKGRNP